MPALKRKQDWPVGIAKGKRVLMQASGGHLLMLGHCVGDCFYTPDIGVDKWEVWKLSELTSPDPLETT
tara:strand:- start:1092 stop:1295 length:204 start_codon:yes stop_codon:yes gene_type:complete